MKKITLALFAVVCSISSGFAQANYVLEAPPNQNAVSALRGPNGTAAHAFQRSVMYIHPYELLPMNSCSINAVSFQYTTGTGSIPVSGNIVLYLQNSTNFAYAKGTTFSGAITGMQQVYSGNFTVPAAAGPATVTIPLSSLFNFTGDGLYVAWDFVSTGPFATNAATMSCSNSFNGAAELWLGSIDAAVGPVGNTLGGSNFRPALIFDAVNTATNEIEVLDIIAPGKVSKLFNTPQEIITHVVNSSIGAQNNVTVAINAVGANPYTATQVLNMAPGAIASLTFNAYNPTIDGQSTITAAVLFPDQILANNTKTWTQMVSCSEISQQEPNITFNNSIGFNGAGCFVARHEIPTSASLTAIKVAIGSSPTNTLPVYGVLVSSTGAILAASINTPNASPATTATFNFANVAVAPGTYYIGLAQPTGSFLPMAYRTNTVFVPQIYYSLPLAGGALAQVMNDSYFGIDGVFTFSNTAMSVVPSKTVVCKNAGQTVSLTASGLDTYTWTPANGNASVAVVTPTIAQASGVVVYTVIGTDATSGCRGVQSTITLSVSACTGIAANSSNGFNVNLFPNPAVNGKSTISGLVGTNVVTVLNTLGQVVLTQNVSTETTEIDLSSQPSGNYIVRITDSNKESRMVKVVNQN